MHFLLTTEPGIEDVAADEVLERLPRARALVEPCGCRGLIRVEADTAAPLFELATIHHVIEIRGEADVATLDDVRHAVGRIEFPDLVDAASFRVTSACSSEQEYTRRELQGAAGAVLQRRYGTRVDLTEFDVNVRVDLYGCRLVAGVQRTKRSLGKRIQRAKVLRTSMQPTIAAAMVRLAGAHSGGGRLIDPLCGTGTIPIEAKRMNPRLDVYACDWDRGTFEVAGRTMVNHDLAIDVRVGDARSLPELYSETFDYIVTDPPYGVRLGKHSGIAALYRALVPSLVEVLAQDGRIVVAVLKSRTFLGALEQSGLRVLAERVVGAGDLRPRLVVLGR